MAVIGLTLQRAGKLEHRSLHCKLPPDEEEGQEEQAGGTTSKEDEKRESRRPTSTEGCVLAPFREGEERTRRQPFSGSPSRGRYRLGSSSPREASLKLLRSRHPQYLHRALFHTI